MIRKRVRSLKLREALWLLVVAGVVIALSEVPLTAEPSTDTQVAAKVQIPRFKIDSTWPKPLPNGWMLGWVGGLVVDPNDHVWIVHVGSQLRENEKKGGTTDPPTTLCCKPAPPVIEFDQEGNVVQAWGGPGAGYDWPSTEHGLFIDHEGNVWITSSHKFDADGNISGYGGQVLKFTRDGKFLLQIGMESSGKGSNDTSSLGGPAGIAVDPETNEVFIADGYRNRRVIVFDATTGAYKRHWGGYGEKPDDGLGALIPLAADSQFTYDPDKPLPRQMSGVHCLSLSTDGLLYVCDRASNRIQVFERDGTFVREVQIEPRLGLEWYGTTHDIAFSQDPAQQFLYVADGANEKIWILDRKDLRVLDSFGHGGHSAGAFITVHVLGVDSAGNLFAGESTEGKRVQRFLYQGLTR